MSKALAISIVRTLREHGHQAYLVGGCVRDLLLGREPADYDVSTDAMPDEVMRIFPETYAVGAQFGVVLVPLPDELRPVILSEEADARSAPATQSKDLLFSNTNSASKSPPSAATSAIPTAAIPTKSSSAAIRAKTSNAATSPSTACSLILRRMKSSILSADRTT